MSNKEYFEVPKGSIYSEDYYPYLRPLNIIPSEDPARIRPEPCEEIEIYPGDNPFDVIEEKVKMGENWIFIHEDVLEFARKIPDKLQCTTAHLGEIFNFFAGKFRHPKIVYLNKIFGFEDWKVIWAWKGEGDEDFVRTPVNPERIIKVVMKK